MMPTSLLRSIRVIAVVLAGLAMAAAGPAAQTASKPEHFTALAVNMGSYAGATAQPFDIVINRWSTDAERDLFMNTLLEKGQDKLLETVKKLPAVGSMRTPDSRSFELHYARKESSGGTDRISITTDRPIGFAELSNQPRSMDYPFTMIDLRIGSAGQGEGKMSYATKIMYDKASKTIVFEEYASQPILLNSVRRVK